MAGQPEARVVVYSRPGCHLCEDAVEILEHLRRHYAFAIEVIDIDGDLDLQRDIGFLIPVVVVDGNEPLTAPISTADLERAIASLPRRRWSIRHLLRRPWRRP